MSTAICGKATEIFKAEKADAPLVIINGYEQNGGELYAKCKELGCPDFHMAQISGLNWNSDLSPWAITQIYKNDEPFDGKADEYLDLLLSEILPHIIREIGTEPEYIAIAGYSLAGLFALYSMYKTDVFSRAASASGSLWFPDFIDYARNHAFIKKPQKLYFSLGDKESKTKNPIMCTVQDNTELLVDYYKKLGIDTLFELNAGNHFQDADERMAKGIHNILL